MTGEQEKILRGGSSRGKGPGRAGSMGHPRKGEDRGAGVQRSV